MPPTPTLAGLADLVLAEPTLAEALEDAHGGRVRAFDLTGPEAARPFVVTGLARAGRTVLAVTATVREAEDLVEQLGSLLDADSVALYPSWETLPHERLSPRSDTVGRRLAVLRRLAHPDSHHGAVQVVVAPVRSVLQPQVKGLGDLEPVELVKGQTAPLEEVVERLAAAAYSRVDLVERRGEYAVRSARCSTPTRSRSTRAGRRCPTSGSARAATPSAAGSRCCAGWPTPTTRRHGPLQVVVAPVRSVLQPQVKGLGDLEPVELVPGQTAPLEDVVQRLADAAYSRVDLVERRGEFAVRGGIVDVFPPTEEHPLRVEFWGDDVEEIRSFSVADQRTHETGRAALGAAVPRAAAHRRRARAAPGRWASSTRSWSS